MSSADPLSPNVLAELLVQEFATAIGATLGNEPLVVETPTLDDTSWLVAADVTGAAAGTILLGMSAEDASTLAQRVLGGNAPDEALVLDTFKELADQAFGGLGRKSAGCRFATHPPTSFAAASTTGQRVGFVLHVASEFSPRVTVWVAVSAASAQASAPRHGERTHETPGGAGSATVPANLEVILDIDLPLAVRFGETQMTVDALTRLGPGSLIDLGRSPDDPVDVLVNGRLVARGEVVVVSGNYGVRILQVMNAADRIRTLGA